MSWLRSSASTPSSLCRMAHVLCQHGDVFCSQQALLERMDSSLDEMKDEMGSKMDSLNS